MYSNKIQDTQTIIVPATATLSGEAHLDKFMYLALISKVVVHVST